MTLDKTKNICDPRCVLEVIEECSVYCFLQLNVDHMFWFYRKNKCDPGCVFDVLKSAVYKV